MNIFMYISIYIIYCIHIKLYIQITSSAMSSQFINSNKFKTISSEQFINFNRGGVARCRIWMGCEPEASN